jgi:signal transduction histidine kinase
MGRGALALFIGVVVLAIAQVAWWIYFLIRTGGQSHLVMFASEGAFFMVALLTGVFLMYRALTEQMRLRQMRATFLSAVTHELKSPIAAIRLFLETIAEDRVDAEKRKDLVKKMLLDTDRLERLVSDLLQAGQIEAHALVPSLEDVDLATVAEEAVEAAKPRLGPDDTIDLHAMPVKVLGQWDLLLSVVQNLLDNAIKYSKPPRRIAVRVDPGGSLVVSDKGVGIDAAGLEHAFEAFYRSGNEEARRQKGTGLGLYLVDGIVRAHGGKCRIESGGEGQGTTVRCSIPVKFEASGGGLE